MTRMISVALFGMALLLLSTNVFGQPPTALSPVVVLLPAAGIGQAHVRCQPEEPVVVNAAQFQEDLARSNVSVSSSRTAVEMGAKPCLVTAMLHPRDSPVLAGG